MLRPTLAVLSALLLASPSVQAWDGAITGKVFNLDVASAQDFGLRIILEGTPIMCANGATWAYLNESDSNYKVYVAAFMLAKAQGSQVKVYSTTVGAFCHIGYVSVQNLRLALTSRHMRPAPR